MNKWREAKWREALEIALAGKEADSNFFECVTDTEWGVDFVILSKSNHGAIYAYRGTNPHVNFAWKIGHIEDVAQEIEEMEQMYKEYIGDETN